MAARIGETDDWEFKAARGGVPGSLWATYRTMANTIGDKILLGVSETDAQFQIVKRMVHQNFSTNNDKSI